jgi:hypothetical protein
MDLDTTEPYGSTVINRVQPDFQRSARRKVDVAKNPTLPASKADPLRPSASAEYRMGQGHLTSSFPNPKLMLNCQSGCYRLPEPTSLPTPLLRLVGLRGILKDTLQKAVYCLTLPDAPEQRMFRLP